MISISRTFALVFSIITDDEPESPFDDDTMDTEMSTMAIPRLLQLREQLVYSDTPRVIQSPDPRVNQSPAISLLSHSTDRVEEDSAATSRGTDDRSNSTTRATPAGMTNQASPTYPESPAAPIPPEDSATSDHDEPGIYYLVYIT
jgi:hypothetical protein